jgi:hypothetical protein
MADQLAVPAPSDEAVREVAEVILIQRGALSAAKLGILTEEEVANLFLAHMQTTLTRDLTEKNWTESKDLLSETRDAIFGLWGSR